MTTLIEVQRDEYASQVAAVYNEEENKYYRRVKRARIALGALKQLAPDLVPDPSIHTDVIELHGPSFSLPITDFLAMKAPMGSANRYDQNFSTSDNLE